MVEAELPIGTLTFVFTDIEGSTRLLQRLGPMYPDLLEEHKTRLRAAFTTRGGHEVATHGDSFFVVFRSASDAVAAAVDGQRALARNGWPGGESVKVRMGLHTGDATVVGGAYVGLDVHRAARIGAAARGGQVLLSRSCADLVGDSVPPGVTVRDLGDHRLKDLSTPERLHQRLIDGLPSDFPPIRGANPALDNLPTQLTSFVGRDAELGKLSTLIDSARLVTLLGPGGTGKTRLAVELASRLDGRFRDGVRFVPLAAVTDAALVPSSIGQALGILEAGRGEEPVGARVIEFLREREILLVIDNFEQVAQSSAFVADVLRAAREVRVLVTSRSVLGITGEHVFRVPTLRVPDVTGDVPPEDISRFEAVSLFVQRATAVRPGFTVTPDNARAIVEICARLDGLPLAIELAASRVRVLSPQAIVARLADPDPLLRRDSVDVPPRHRALWDTIAWSHDLLEAPERRLFARLAVFNGGGTLEDIAAVVDGVTQTLGIDVLDGVASLVDKSLVNAGEDERGEPRFGMLRTIREFASQRLADSDEEVELRDRHLDTFLTLAATAEPHLLTTGRRSWLDRLEAEIDNFRVALDWAVERQRVAHALRLGGALWRLWQLRGYLREGRARIAAVIGLAGAERQPRLLARAYEAAGGIAHWQGDQAAERAYYEESLRISRELDDQPMIANALFNLAFAHLPLQMTPDDDPSIAEAMLQESRAISNAVGDELGVARTYPARAAQAYFRHDWIRAADLALEGAERLRRVGDAHNLAWSLGVAGQSALQQGDLDVGRRHLHEALMLFAAARDLSGIAVILDQLAAVIMREGDVASAMRLAGAASELTVTTGITFADLARRVADYRSPDRSDGTPDSAPLVAAWDEGKAMTVDEAVAFALERQAPPRERLTEPVA